MNKGKLKTKEWLVTLLVCLIAAVLLIASYKVFFVGEKKAELTEEEARLCTLLKNIDGVGRVIASVNAEEAEKQVVVVCDGADSYLVRVDILRAVAAATGAKTENIVVYKMTAGK